MLETPTLIESIADLDIARKAVTDDVVWYSTSPQVIERLKNAGERAHWAETLLPADWSQEIGLASVATIRALEPDIAGIASSLRWPRLVPFVCVRLAALLSLLIFKRAVVERFALLSERGIIVGDDRMSSVNRGLLQFGRFDTLFAILAEGTSVRVLTRPRQDHRALSRQIDEGIASDRILSQLDLSLGNLTSRVLRFLGKFKRSGNATVYVARENEVIREILPHLLHFKCSLRILPEFGQPSAGQPAASLPDAAAFQEALDRTLRARGVTIDTSIIARITAERLSESSRWWMPTLEKATKLAERLVGHTRSTALLTNTPGSLELVALTECLRQRGASIVVAEHGVSAGLSRLHEASRFWSEAALADTYLACSSGTVDFYRAEPSLQHVRFEAIGLAEQTRKIPLPRLQRAITRLRLMIGPQERMVVYLGRPVQNNLRMLCHWPNDNHLHAIARMVADRVMPNVRGQPVIKLYATRRYIDNDPLLKDFPAPPPVRTLKAGDFRFLRAGVDVIILDLPLSTLGWALGSAKPIFYLADPATPLLPHIREKLEKSVFVIDLGYPDWPETLLQLINRPDEQIRKEWDDKLDERLSFLEHHVFGPERPGENGARVIMDLLRSESQDCRQYTPNISRS